MHKLHMEITENTCATNYSIERVQFSSSVFNSFRVVDSEMLKQRINSHTKLNCEITISSHAVLLHAMWKEKQLKEKKNNCKNWKLMKKLRTKMRKSFFSFTFFLQTSFWNESTFYPFKLVVLLSISDKPFDSQFEIHLACPSKVKIPLTEIRLF